MPGVILPEPLHCVTYSIYLLHNDKLKRKIWLFSLKGTSWDNTGRRADDFSDFIHTDSRYSSETALVNLYNVCFYLLDLTASNWSPILLGMAMSLVQSDYSRADWHKMWCRNLWSPEDVGLSKNKRLCQTMGQYGLNLFLVLVFSWDSMTLRKKYGTSEALKNSSYVWRDQRQSTKHESRAAIQRQRRRRECCQNASECAIRLSSSAEFYYTCNLALARLSEAETFALMWLWH